MDDQEDVTRLPDHFDGRVRLFPLPGLVMFPHSMQPLHIFEPRYCEMLGETMASDQLIAMATIENASDPVSIGTDKPPLSPTVCIGRVVSHSELEDDKHNILLVGIRRARIRCEIDAQRPFRMADVEIIDDVYPPAGATSRLALKGRLLAAFGRVIPPAESVQKNLYELMAGQLTLGPITDIIAYMLPFESHQKLELLGLSNVDRRAESLIELLDTSDLKLADMSVESHSVDNLPPSTDAGMPVSGKSDSTGAANSSAPSNSDPPGDDSNRPFPPPFSVN